MLTDARLNALLNRIQGLTIGVVGDLTLERVLCAKSDEAGVIDRVRNRAMGMATTLEQLASLGTGLIVPLVVIGDDGHGHDLLRTLTRLPLDKSHIIRRRERLTTTHLQWEQAACVIRTEEPLSSQLSEEMCRRLRDVARTSDGVFVCEGTEWFDDATHAVAEELKGAAPRTVRLLHTQSLARTVAEWCGASDEEAEAFSLLVQRQQQLRAAA